MRERMWILTPSGMTSCSSEKMYFILSSGAVRLEVWIGVCEVVGVVVVVAGCDFQTVCAKPEILAIC
jgi:tetrahydromethanopterin S-methyltransferase subunit D